MRSGQNVKGVLGVCIEHTVSDKHFKDDPKDVYPDEVRLILTIIFCIKTTVSLGLRIRRV